VSDIYTQYVGQYTQFLAVVQGREDEGGMSDKLSKAGMWPLLAAMNRARSSRGELRNGLSFCTDATLSFLLGRLRGLAADRLRGSSRLLSTHDFCDVLARYAEADSRSRVIEKLNS
jgi:hypothetical protein